MKLINKCITGILLLTGTILSACSDNFLNKETLSELTTKNFWQTSDDALMGLTACYDGLQSRYIYDGGPWQCGFFNMDCMTDNGGHFNWSGWMCGYDVANGIHTPSSWLIGSFWSESYEVVKRCNLLLDNIERIDMDSVTKETYKAEAKVIRALMYLNLTMTYQNVPYLTAPQYSISDVNCAKSKREDIVKAEMKNLQAAVEILPQSTSRGRITKGAALSILGRMALYNQDWSVAIDSYRKVMSLGYTLEPNYADLFKIEGEKSNEIVFAVRFEGPGKSEGCHFCNAWNAPLESMNGSLDLAKAYYATDGKPFDQSSVCHPGVDRLDINEPDSLRYLNRDPRLKATLFVSGMKWGAKPSDFYGGSAPSLSTVYVYKYFDPRNNADPQYGEYGQDFYVIRYPEVLLSLAEALIMQGGYDINEVIGLVDMVRKRVGMPVVNDVEGKNKTLSDQELLEVVKHERRVETAFEGLRLFDLYRWKELEMAVNTINNEANLNKTGTYFNYETRNYRGEKEYEWPIPLHEIDTNSKLEQNELWK